MSSHWACRAGRWACAACFAAVLAPVGAFAADAGTEETARRWQQTEEARELLVKGDEAYLAGRYDQAVEAFAGARETLPDAPVTQALRSAATERLVIASVEQARELSRKGDVEGAKKVMDRVLAEGVAPDDPAARKMREQLDDPIRTNPALSAEHGGEVDEVRRLLYTAEGSFNLGRYQEAIGTWEKVLRIDPANKAARRGMERAAAAKSDYHRAALDETRASMLAEVDAAWEISPGGGSAGVPQLGNGGGDQAGPVVDVINKAERMIIPVVDFDDISLVEAVDALRSRSIELDTFELDPAKRGISMVIETGPPDSNSAKLARESRFSLKLRNVPLKQVLDYVTQAVGFNWAAEEFAVVMRPVGATSKEMVNRTYRVPPDFLSTGGAAGPQAPADPFAANGGEEEGLLAKKLTARAVLENYGVKFPEGASASFNASNSTLVVRNTQDMHMFIKQIVETAATTEPVQVIVRVTMMKVGENRLKELGFDWMLGNFGLNSGRQFLGGGTIGSGGVIDDILNPPFVNLDTNPVTAGNRSGAQAVPGDAIDARIEAAQNGFTTAPPRAPGVLTAHGLFTRGEMTVVMRGLDQKKGVDVVTVPSVVTRSGQRAIIQVIREFIYPTEYEPPEIPNAVGGGFDGGFGGGGGIGGGGGAFPVTPATPTAFEKRDVGVILEVEPVVSADRRFVDVALNPSLTQFDGFVNYGSPISSPQQVGPLGVGGTTAVQLTPNEILMPVFSVNRANTALTIADGSTIVIGGLLQQKITEVEDSVPVLGQLPMLGRLFQSKVSAPMRKAVFFFVTVELVDPTGHPYRQR